MVGEKDLEKELLERLTRENPGRRVTAVAGSRWGRLILPADDEAARLSGEGLRVVLFGSWTLGFLSFEALLSMKDELGGAVNLVGLVTDDPLDVDARISVKKRFWDYYKQERREEYEWGILRSALSVGVPCYTGEIKSDAFREILRRWAPGAIIVSAFGQVIDQYIIDVPAYGIYNVHPSDLLQRQGAGPRPWEDLIARKAPTARVTVHRVSTLIDSGEIVGQSPEINVLLADGSTSDDVRLVGEKTLVAVAPMVRELTKALADKRASGKPGPIDFMDFERLLGRDLKAQLMEPLDPRKKGYLLPLPEEEMVSLRRGS